MSMIPEHKVEERHGRRLHGAVGAVHHLDGQAAPVRQGDAAEPFGAALAGQARDVLHGHRVQPARALHQQRRRVHYCCYASHAYRLSDGGVDIPTRHG